MQINVINGQSILDIALEYTGLWINAYPIFLHNKNLGLMDDFDEDISLKTIIIPDNVLSEKYIILFYKKNNHKIINQ